MIQSEKGIVSTRNHLELITSASNHYFLNKYIELRIEALTGYIHFQDMENFQNTEGLVLNCVEIPAEIQDMEISRIWKLNITHSIS